MANISYVKVSSTWKNMLNNYVKVSGVWKLTKTIWIKVSGVWKKGGSSLVIPSTGIIPFVGTVVPTGFTRYTGADAKFIIGAGSTYTVGATSTGTGNVSKSGTTTSLGAHQGGTLFTTPNDPSGSPYSGLNRSAGGHSHTFSGMSVPTLDKCKDFILIQATNDEVVPIDGAIMAHQAITTTLTEIETSTDAFLRSNTSYGGTAGSANPSHAVETSSDGSHRHAYYDGGNTYPAAYPTSWNNSAGAHSHTITGTYGLNTKYRYLQFLSNTVSSDFISDGCIIMWPTATPPAGWVVCDGTNGTPDMRDYYLRVGNSTNRNNSGGNNSATFGYTTNSAGSHSHNSGNFGSDNTAAEHSNSMNSHTHNQTQSNEVIIQPYTALTFIMKV